MINNEQFKQIKELQSVGFTQVKISQKLGLRKTDVAKCWRLTDAGFMEAQKQPRYKQRMFQLDNYKNFILDIIRVHPQMRQTSIYYKLQQEFPDFKVKQSTFYAYIAKLREESGLQQFTSRRVFGVRERLPMGEEAQVDFGQYKMKTMYGTNVKVYFFCMVISHSNFRFVHFEPKPFTTKAAIKAHNFAFQYFGGRPKTILYDLDSVFVCSENYGNIVFVKEFEDFVRDTGYTARFCHARDPQSKGRVESIIGFIKHSFLDSTVYYGLDALNMAALAWLDGKGNETITASKPYSPRMMFREEQKHLISVAPIKLEKSLYTINNTRNTILYKGNEYELPKGSYLIITQVRVEVEVNQLHIYNPESSELLCQHEVAVGTHAVVKYHEEHQTRLKEEQMALHFEGDALFDEYMRRLKLAMPQYANKQSLALKKVAEHYSKEEMQLAFRHCIRVNICHFNELMAFLAFKFGKPRARKLMEKKYNSIANRVTQIEGVYNG